jgi:hypothetical protein
MVKSALLLCVFVACFAFTLGLSRIAPQFSEYKLNLVRDELNKLQTIMKTSKKIALTNNLGDMSIECNFFCG